MSDSKNIIEMRASRDEQGAGKPARAAKERAPRAAGAPDYLGLYATAA